MSGTYLVYPL